MAPITLTREDITNLNQPQQVETNLKTLEALGGVNGVVKKLGTNAADGLCDEGDLSTRREMFGSNAMPTPEPKSWIELFIETFEDTTVIILCVSAIVSLIVGIYNDPEKGWIEGVAILLAVLIVGVVTATNDYTKEQQFRKLNAINDDITVKALRNGKLYEMSTNDIVVGDMVHLESGDKIPADGLLVSGNDVVTLESALTGEPDEKNKDFRDDHWGGGTSSTTPFLLSGTEVTNGAGVMVVLAVGAQSQWGRIKAKLTKTESNTPLQDKLEVLAEQIGYVGMFAAGATFIAMMILYMLNPALQQSTPLFNHMLDAFIIGVTIVVVAVPEGLPLAVTISLAFSTKKMLKDNNLIRVLAACETMGNATTICSDKTGTLTLNRMTVVQSFFAGLKETEDPAKSLTSLDRRAEAVLVSGMSVNTTASLGGEDQLKVIGNKTEGALLLLLKRAGIDPEKIKRSQFDASRDRLFPFNSTRKRMSTLVCDSEKCRLYTKGAAEVIVDQCSEILKPDGSTETLKKAKRTELAKLIEQWASMSFRVIALAHREVPESMVPADHASDDDLFTALVLDGLVAIQDPLRPDVTEAVRICQRAGIVVRMVTGDNLNTAKAIARECGIYTDDGVALAGPDFRKMTPQQLDAVLPNLQVLARSSPEDKHTLVTRLNGVALPTSREEWENEHAESNWDTDRDLLLPGYRDEWELSRHDGIGDVVGVTGDGTNDGPALRAAEVGLSMGLSGTDVAKEASDIVIMDDNFSSIVKAVMWGRCVFDNIRKFLQFQLTVNIVALVTTFLSAVYGIDPPLNAVMMLWVNLIMDTMGALALGTEAPTDKLLDRLPLRRNAPLISRVMWRNILVQSLYQLVLLMIILVHGKEIFGVEQESLAHFTIVFNTFVFCQVFNEFNARSIGDDINVFGGLFKNIYFQVVVILTVVAQVFIVQRGGDFTKTVPMSLEHWGRTILMASVTLPLGVFMRFLPVEEDPLDFVSGRTTRVKQGGKRSSIRKRFSGRNVKKMD